MTIPTTTPRRSSTTCSTARAARSTSCRPAGNRSARSPKRRRIRPPACRWSVRPFRSRRAATTAVADVKAVIDGYKQSGLPPELVEVAKARELAQAQFREQLDQRSRIRCGAKSWRSSTARPTTSSPACKRSRVDDVNRVLRTYYDNATATVAIATPKAAAGSAFGGREGENNSVPPTAHTVLPAFARNVLAQLHVPDSTVHPDVQTLPNGIKLITVQSSISPTVVLARPDSQQRRRADAARQRRRRSSARRSLRIRHHRPTTGSPTRPNSTRSRPT